MLTFYEREDLLRTLKGRFEANPDRHPDVEWATVRLRLESRGESLWSLREMERTGGEPDVIEYHAVTGACLFCDCSEETPKGRRSLCYDAAALDTRKAHKPRGSVVEMAAAMGVQLLDEDQYRALQKLGHFDTRTSSWVQTPANIRQLGGALFCDRRYDTIFLYHNGADAYFAARGFRALLRV